MKVELTEKQWQALRWLVEDQLARTIIKRPTSYYGRAVLRRILDKLGLEWEGAGDE